MREGFPAGQFPRASIPSEAQIFPRYRHRWDRGNFQGNIHRTGRGWTSLCQSACITRPLVALQPGGSSELVPHGESVYTMKDYVDGGGTSVLGGFLHSLKDVAIGEGIGLVGQGLGTLGGKIVGSLADELPNSITGPIQQGLKDIKDALNTEIKNRFAGESPGFTGTTTPHIKTTADINDDILTAASALRK